MAHFASLLHRLLIPEVDHDFETWRWRRRSRYAILPLALRVANARSSDSLGCGLRCPEQWFTILKSAACEDPHLRLHLSSVAGPRLPLRRGRPTFPTNSHALRQECWVLADGHQCTLAATSSDGNYRVNRSVRIGPSTDVTTSRTMIVLTTDSSISRCPEALMVS